MKPFLFLCLPLACSAADVSIDGHTFRVPDGFTVEKVAGPPLVNRPIVADFDERGYLYVADSSGSNDAPEKQLANPTHRIVRLEDTDADGKYDKSIVFADKMMFPEGAMWRDGSLYVAAPPSIWKLTDTDGDGVCDKREEWFKGKTLTGCANDLHGPYNGPDGWIYWCKGAFAEQTYTLPNGKPFKTRAAHIFRAKPDGSNIEPVITGGMDNPVEIAWSPGGEMFFTSTFVVHPGGGQRDGIVHGVYGGVYGKDHDVIDGHIRTGPDLMPIMTHLGPAAPSGLMRYESSAFGTAYKDNLFCAQFNMHKVSRHVLEPVGATFKTTDSDFLSVADHHDFHPTDVLEDADGSILVLDTGGWYKLCCPTSQIGKPDVLGGIYRVRRINAAKVDDPRGLNIAWAKLQANDLGKLLDDPRPIVRRRAVETLGRLDLGAVDILFDVVASKVATVTARQNAIWAGSRQPDHGASGIATAASIYKRQDAGVREAAMHVLALIRDVDDPLLEGIGINLPVRMMGSAEAQGNRVMAEAIGRWKAHHWIPRLLKTLDSHPDDRVMEHSVVFALTQMEMPDLLTSKLAAANARQLRALLIAIDQSGGTISIEHLNHALRAEEPALREAAQWIVERHLEYADAMAPDFITQLEQDRINSADLAILEQQLARFSNAPKIREIVATVLRSKDTLRDRQVMALRAVAKSGLRTLPGEWRDGLTLALRSDDPVIATEAIAAARAVPFGKEDAGEFASALQKIADRDDAPSSLRLDALASLPNGPGTLSEPVYGFLRVQTGPDLPVSTRLAAAGILAKSQLSADQLTNLADALRVAGPLDVVELLPAFDHATDDAIGRKVVEALKASPALTSLRVDTLKPRFAKFGKPVQEAAESLYAVIDKAQSDQRAKLDDLAKTIPEGDIRRGQAVFNSTKAACTSCHAIGYVGGKVGPDLSAIGAIRNDRDLLESIVFPSASFVRSYEPMVVATKGGIVHSGVVKKDAPDEVVLATGPDKEVRISRAEVDEMKPGTVSVMPSGLDSQMTKQELADLVAFLKSRK